MMTKRANLTRTHAFAQELLKCSDQYVRFWLFGRLSIIWDTDRSVPKPVPTESLFPEPDDIETP